MRTFRVIFITFSYLSLLTSCAVTPIPTAPIEAKSTGKAYLGIVFDPLYQGQGIAIRRILPGPLKQALQNQLDIDVRQDRLIRINQQTISTDNFIDTIEQYQAGDQVELIFVKEPIADEKVRLTSVTVTLGNTSEWQGPIKKADNIASSETRPKYLPDVGVKNAIVNFINTKTQEHDLQTEVTQLYSLFNDWQYENTGFHSLSRVMFPFQHPEYLLELEKTITQPLATLEQKPETIFNEIAKNLDLTHPVSNNCNTSYIQDWDTLLKTISKSKQFLDKAFIQFNDTEKKLINDQLYYLISEYANLRTIDSQLQPLQSLDAINASMKIDFNALLNSATSFECFINKQLTIELTAKQINEKIPYELRNAIKGKIKAAIKQDEQWIVYGSEDNNTYDMSMIDIVYDPGGNDTYQYNKPDPFKIKLIIDKSGNDNYLSDNIGHASGWLGTSILIDHQGNDTYQGKLAANGAGMMGIGLLIDYAGQDIYKGDHFSNGASVYGAGLILDLGKEADQYHSVTFSQGFGGPRGLGLIYDYSGNDLYRANGPSPSVYGTPSVFVSFSQGIGFGLRHYDSGGIGIIYDQQGHDRYEGGEFSQAGAYYWGLGIIHDEQGNDNYYGNRYSQGFGVHQATGILFDGSGNDNYWSITAACQGAAWDVAMGLLIDIKGNDTYSGNGLCQGSAAMQAMGWLIDLDGVDHYTANSQSAQGHSGNNTYHYDPETPVYSWSMLLDAGGKQDFFSNERNNNQVIRHSEFNQEQPAESWINGLFIDTSEVLNY